MPDPQDGSVSLNDFGPNEWLVDELYEQYKKDRNSVDKAWWEFFENYTPGQGTGGSNGTSAKGDAPAASEPQATPAPEAKKAEPTAEPKKAEPKAEAKKAEAKPGRRRMARVA